MAKVTLNPATNSANSALAASGFMDPVTSNNLMNAVTSSVGSIPGSPNELFQKYSNSAQAASSSSDPGQYQYKFGDWITGNMAAGLASDNEFARNWALQKDSQNFNSAEAAKQREYETEMSNTSYQRAVADLEAAGLNKYSLFMNADGASTPSGSAASSSANRVSAANTNGIGSLLAKIASIAVSAYSAGQIAKNGFINATAKQYTALNGRKNVNYNFKFGSRS